MSPIEIGGMCEQFWPAQACKRASGANEFGPSGPEQH